MELFMLRELDLTSFNTKRVSQQMYWTTACNSVSFYVNVMLLIPAHRQSLFSFAA